MTGQTFVSAAQWFSPINQGWLLFPTSEGDLWLEDLAPGTEPETELSSPFVHLQSWCQSPPGKERRGKRESADESKDGFEVQSRSGDQEVRAVIATGYQFPFLFQESPRHGAVELSPSESRHQHCSPLQEELLNGRGYRQKNSLHF